MIWPNKTHTLGDLSLRATFAIPFAGDDLTHVGYLFADNCQPPQLFHTNLKLQGIGDRYRVLRHGQAFTWPE